MFPKLLFPVCVVLFFPAFAEMSKGEELEESESDECKCGTALNPEIEPVWMIIDGDAVGERSKYPWMVSIKKKGELQCGGALISPSVILTAAHCFSRANVMHALDSGHKTCKTTDGEGPCYHPLSTFTADGKEKSGLKNGRIQRVIVHPKYGFYVHEYDIALIQLRKPVRCGMYTQPICLPSEVPELKAGSEAVIAGWGLTQPMAGGASAKLMEANLTLMGQEECRKYGGDKETHICAKGDAQGACMGDSGGPLMSKVRSKYYVYGVVSHGTNVECDPDQPQFYSNVKLFVDWIRKNMKKIESNESDSEM